MIPCIPALTAVTFAALIAAVPTALAHPHVLTTVKSEVIYRPDGTAMAVRHAWTFDEMFSGYAVQDVQPKQKGAFTREELQPLAKVNVTSLKEYDYFTHARVNGQKGAVGDPSEYWLEFKDSLLTLHFVVPFKTPVKARNLEIEIYDPSYLVDFIFAEKDPVRISGAPPGCKLSYARPQEMSIAEGKRLGDAFFNNPGMQGSNKISVSCP
jgi:ABC-type uncharacterized transport system substrate-binding protein